MLNEKQKEIFLDLAYQLAFIDNDFSEKERVMIESYCKEMEIAVPEVIRAKPIGEIVESMRNEYTMIEKKITVFEILGLAIVDGNYDEDERKIVEEIMKALEIEKSFAEKSEKILKEYIGIQSKINALVLEK